MTELLSSLSCTIAKWFKPADDRVFKYHCVMVGDQKVGKTTLRNKLGGSEMKFTGDYKETIRMDFSYYLGNSSYPNMAITLVEYGGKYIPKLPLFTGYITKPQITTLIVMYDITSHESFGVARETLKQYSAVYGRSNILYLVIGNKFDLESERKVSTEEGEKLTQGYKGMFFEISLKNADDKTIAPIRACINKFTNRFVQERLAENQPEISK